MLGRGKGKEVKMRGEQKPGRKALAFKGSAEVGGCCREKSYTTLGWWFGVGGVGEGNSHNWPLTDNLVSPRTNGSAMWVCGGNGSRSEFCIYRPHTNFFPLLRVTSLVPHIKKKKERFLLINRYGVGWATTRKLKEV